MSSENALSIAGLQAYTFISGELTVNFSQNRVSFQHHELVLQPKVLELLVLLCAAQGQTLSKQILTAALWPNTIVGPDSLANTVTRLRKALNDNAKQPVFIETVQRKGYRWLQEVSLVNVETRDNDKQTRHVIFKQLGINKVKRTATIIAIVVATLSAWWFYGYSVNPVEKQLIHKFPFPDLHIERLAEGGYEIQVGIKGELTEARKAAMLKEIKRITGEEHSDMIFTLDPIEPSCNEVHDVNGSGGKEKATCKAKPLKPKPD